MTETQAQRAAAAVDEDRLWQRLMDMARHGATPAGGVNRQAFSAEDAEARKTMVTWAEELGLQCTTDEIGNLFLRRPGRDPSAGIVMTGSHLDSQPTGGKFDGAYGVLAGLEVLQAIASAGIETRRGLEVVAWVNEEGSRFQPGATGSLVFSGKKAAADFHASTDSAGVTLGEELDALLAATPDLGPRPTEPGLAAYIEAHIEQGPILEDGALAIGVVEAVQGSRWFSVEVRGDAAHAGTTPLGKRRDALRAAAAMVERLGREMHDPEDRVRFTVGRFEVEPNSPNTVSARVFFTIDFRHPEQEVIDRLTALIEPVCQELAGGCEVTVTRTINVPPTPFDTEVVDTIDRCAEGLSLPRTRMISGAGHDAMHLAAITPTGMIFIPCEKGISHNEIENTTPADTANGARVLAAALVELANR